MPNLIVESNAVLIFPLAKHVHIDSISFLEDAYFLRSDITEDTHAKTWTWEWVTTNKVLRYTHIATNAANLILEEELEWFAEFEVHLFRQTTYVVVALDHLTRVVDRLDDIWVNSTLAKPFCIGNLLSFLIEYLDEVTTDNLTFLFWVSHTSEVAIEALFSVHTNHIEAEALVVAEHVFKLVFAEQTMVHKDTCELVANSAIKQNGCDRTIHATREGKDNALITNLLFELRNGSLYKVSGSPILCAMAGVKHEGTELIYCRLLAFSNVKNRDTAAEAAESVLECLRLFHRVFISRKDKTDDFFVIFGILVVR